jgi:predicted DNA-binding protein YlxM (UPF0122 family)
MPQFRVVSVKETDHLSVSEWADLFGFSVSALIAAIERNRQAIRKPFYSIPDLAKRWNCSRATVYNILRESEFKLFNLSRKGKKKGKWNVPASVVEHIEQARMQALPHTLAS